MSEPVVEYVYVVSLHDGSWPSVYKTQDRAIYATLRYCLANSCKAVALGPDSSCQTVAVKSGWPPIKRALDASRCLTLFRFSRNRVGAAMATIKREVLR